MSSKNDSFTLGKAYMDAEGFHVEGPDGKMMLINSGNIEINRNGVFSNGVNVPVKNAEEFNDCSEGHCSFWEMAFLSW